MRTYQVSILLFVLPTVSVPSLAQTGNGSLKVTSYPTGAAVFIDGVDTGKATPISESLTTGEHSVVVRVPILEPGMSTNANKETIRHELFTTDYRLHLSGVPDAGGQRDC